MIEIIIEMNELLLKLKIWILNIHFKYLARVAEGFFLCVCVSL